MSASIAPDCRDGKHRACTGDSWDVDLDQACACSCDCHAEQTAAVSGAQAADWLVRSALPAFCDLAGLTEDAAWFRQLEPYQGHTPSGRVKGWQGAGRRVLAIEEQINNAYGDLHRVVREAGGALYVKDREIVSPDAHTEVCRVAVFGRKVLLPSRVGWDAYRTLSTISNFAAHAGHFHGVSGYAEDVNRAWDEAWVAIADRSRLRELETT